MADRIRKEVIPVRLDASERAAVKLLAERIDQDMAKVLRIAVTAMLAHAERLGGTPTTAQLREAMMPPAAQGKLAMVGGGRK